MNILIVNCGSSSLSYKVYQVSPDNQSEAILSGKARNVAARTQAEPLIEWNTGGIKRSKNCPLPSHAVAAAEMLRVLSQEGIEVDAAGHRLWSRVWNHRRVATLNRASSLRSRRRVARSRVCVVDWL